MVTVKKFKQGTRLHKYEYPALVKWKPQEPPWRKSTKTPQESQYAVKRVMKRLEATYCSSPFDRVNLPHEKVSFLLVHPLVPGLFCPDKHLGLKKEK